MATMLQRTPLYKVTILVCLSLIVLYSIGMLLLDSWLLSAGADGYIMFVVLCTLTVVVTCLLGWYVLLRGTYLSWLFSITLIVYSLGLLFSLFLYRTFILYAAAALGFAGLAAQYPHIEK